MSRQQMGTIHDTLALAWQHYRCREFAHAERLYRQVLEADRANAHVWGLLGGMCHLQNRPADAVMAYRQATSLQPHDSALYSNLGVTLRESGCVEEAIACYRQAIRLDPSNAAAHNNLGNALLDNGRPEEAAGALQESLRLKPEYFEAQNNLANVYCELGRYGDAFVCIENALRLRPGYAEARFNRAIEWLRQGDFERGWPEYEWRRQCKQLVSRHFTQPVWDGSELERRRILLYAEQGLGDTIQFARYARLVQERGGHVIVECAAALHPLLRTCSGIDELAACGDPLPQFNVQAPLLSLAGIFRTTLETIPARMPYLCPDNELKKRWEQELRPLDGFKIGIHWQGNPHHPMDRYRSVLLRHFEPIANTPGVRLMSLQKGPGAAQLMELNGRFHVNDLGSRLDEPAGAFMDTAAVMHHLDLVITSDTSIAHLAGALNVPVWVPLAYAADFRWLLGREDSPWYPSMRLFRQKELGAWDEVFQRIAVEIKKLTPS